MSVLVVKDTAKEAFKGLVRLVRKRGPFSSRCVLGIAVEDKGFSVAQVHKRKGRYALEGAGFFPFEKDSTTAEALGKELEKFLESNNFKAVRAVIGLPLRWVIAKQKAVPPCGEEELKRLIQLEAERAFSSEGRNLLVDYISPVTSRKDNRIVLCGAKKERVDCILKAVEACGITPEAVTVTIGALACASSKVSESGSSDFVAQLGPENAEVAVRRGGKIESFLRIGIGSGGSEELRKRKLISEFKRTVTALGWEDGKVRLVLWKGEWWEDGIGEELVSCRLFSGIDKEDATGFVQTDGRDWSQLLKFAGAVVLARSYFEPGLRPVDFLNSKLKPERKKMLSGPARIACVGAAFLSISVGALGISYLQASSAVSRLKKELAQIKPAVQRADSLTNLIRKADRWYGNRPPYLDCLLELTKVFGEDNSVWARGLSMSETGSCVLSGRAEDYGAVLSFLRRLSRSTAFSEVKLHGRVTRPTQRGSDGFWNFSVEFQYRRLAR